MDVIPHIKPSPPDREAIEGNELKYVDEDGEEVVDLLYLSQHTSTWFPLASMAQKNPFSPNEAAIGPSEPYPKAVKGSNWSRGRRWRRKMDKSERHLWIDMASGFGLKVLAFT